MRFHKDILQMDCEAVTKQVCSFIQQQLVEMKRNGAVVGLSGGIDSTLSTELCVRALGKDKVLGLILPERESNSISAEYAMKYAQKEGIRTVTIDITPNLDCLGAYEKRDDAIKEIFPEYNSKYKSKIILPPELLSKDSFNVFKLIIDDGNGNIKSARLDNRSLREIVAATNIKQRTRMMNLYYFAERNNYLVCGTTNKTETVQGFFVKCGDGGVDIEPIAKLYKTQIYRLAGYLGVEKEIIERLPSPDTYSLNVTDEEFYFRIPYDTLDLLLYAWENDVAITEVCEVMTLTEQQVTRAFRDFTSKYNATKHLRTLPPTPELLV